MYTAEAPQSILLQRTNDAVRVSIVGHENEEGESSSSVPYTYSELDWSSPDWTPSVVIRADPCAALAAAQRLEDMADEFVRINLQHVVFVSIDTLSQVPSSGHNKVTVCFVC